MSGPDIALAGHAAKRPPATESGVEIGRFRLRQGLGEDTMRAAYRVMVDTHLARQPGWRGQYLVKLQGSVFVDLAFADTPERAVEICASWHGAPACAAFLAMVEPETMEFGAVLHEARPAPADLAGGQAVPPGPGE